MPTTNATDLESAKRQVVAAGIAIVGVALGYTVILFSGIVGMFALLFDHLSGVHRSPFASLLSDGTLLASAGILQAVAAVLCALLLLRRLKHVEVALGSWIGSVLLIGAGLAERGGGWSFGSLLAVGGVLAAIGALSAFAWQLTRPAA